MKVSHTDHSRRTLSWMLTDVKIILVPVNHWSRCWKLWGESGKSEGWVWENSAWVQSQIWFQNTSWSRFGWFQPEWKFSGIKRVNITRTCILPRFLINVLFVAVLNRVAASGPSDPPLEIVPAVSWALFFWEILLFYTFKHENKGDILWYEVSVSVYLYRRLYRSRGWSRWDVSDSSTCTRTWEGSQVIPPNHFLLSIPYTS